MSDGTVDITDAFWTDPRLSRIGFGAFKIGRNQGIKYDRGYDLPTEDEAATLLNALLDLGVTYIDTAPAYGLSEERIGRHLHGRGDEFIVSTKVGETFVDGESHYDFSRRAVQESLARSRKRLQRDPLDLVFVHSNGDDLHIQQHTDVVLELMEARRRGEVHRIGYSGKTVEGAALALHWADAIMVEYHLEDDSHRDVMAAAGKGGLGVVVKKALASGRLDPVDAIQFALAHPAVTSAVVGTLNPRHVQQLIEAAVPRG